MYSCSDLGVRTAGRLFSTPFVFTTAPELLHRILKTFTKSNSHGVSGISCISLPLLNDFAGYTNHTSDLQTDTVFAFSAEPLIII